MLSQKVTRLKRLRYKWTGTPSTVETAVQTMCLMAGLNSCPFNTVPVSALNSRNFNVEFQSRNIEFAPRIRAIAQAIAS